MRSCLNLFPEAKVGSLFPRPQRETLHQPHLIQTKSGELPTSHKLVGVLTQFSLYFYFVLE